MLPVDHHLLSLFALVWLAAPARLTGAEPLHPGRANQEPAMLGGHWVPANTHAIDFQKLPRVPSVHAVVSDVRQHAGVNQHNYLAHHHGKYWLMWSDGPGVEDLVGQRVKFATSDDGLRWSKAEFLTPAPPDSAAGSPHYGQRTDRGFRYIARGFWQREGELLGLCALDEAGGYFGRSLQLRAFRLDPDTATWRDTGLLYKNAINNFPPGKLPTGEWMMSRRTHDYTRTGVQFLIGGIRAIDAWESFPVFNSNQGLAAEEPMWWTLADDKTLMALFRDNLRSGFLYRTFSTDNGRNWSAPARTNFPDATSKFHGLRLRDGRYLLVSNANPGKRDPLVLSLGDDGRVFHTMGYLVGGRQVDYPHVLEHDGQLLIAFSGAKQTVEVLRVRVADLAALKMP